MAQGTGGGLLDFIQSPAGMGLLSAGLAYAANANRDTPVNNIGRAGLAGLTGYTAAGALQEQQTKRKQAEQIRQAIPTLYTQGPDGSMKFDTIAAARMGIDPDTIKGYAEVPNFGRAKVARTQAIAGPDGSKRVVQLDDYGNQVGDGLAGYVAPQLVDTGDSKQFVVPTAGQSFQVGLSPAEILANQRGQASLQLRQEANELARDRLGFEKGQRDGGGYSTKPLPAGALKIQDEALNAFGSAGTIDQILAQKEKQIADGKLSFGPVSNALNNAYNMSGFSTEGSRNFASFKSDLERMRNESLRLNTGVQTDGDAQRAWNELFQNINDPQLVKQRISEIRAINKRGAELQKLRVDNVRSNYNAEPYDFSSYEPQQQAAPQLQQRQIVRTGTSGGRKVIQYSDGSLEYAD